MCASRLISQARRWRMSSAGERRSRSSFRIGPGSSIRTGAGLVEPGQEEEIGGLAELVVDVPVALDLAGTGDDRQAISDGRRESLPPLDEGGWIEWAHRRNNTTAKGERPMHVGMAAVFQNPGKARTDREVYRNELRLRSEEHTSELQSRGHLVCRLLLEK